MWVLECVHSLCCWIVHMTSFIWHNCTAPFYVWHNWHNCTTPCRSTATGTGTATNFRVAMFVREERIRQMPLGSRIPQACLPCLPRVKFRLLFMLWQPLPHNSNRARQSHLHQFLWRPLPANRHSPPHQFRWQSALQKPHQQTGGLLKPGKAHHLCRSSLLCLSTSRQRQILGGISV